MLDALPDDRARNALLANQAELKTSLYGLFRGKLQFWRHGVYRAIGAYHSEQGGSVGQARLILREVVAEYDNAITTGAGARVGRVARLLFQKGCEVRYDCDRFINGERNRSGQ